MTVPTIEKTWQFDVNQSIEWVDYDTSWRTTMFLLKESLKGFPLSPWTVVGSSNSVAAGMDGVDRLAAPANLIAGGNHSWIVLQQNGLNAGFQVCFDFTGGGSGTVAVSPSAGFTGGSIAARPTATDEYTMTLNGTGTAYWGIANFGVPFKYNLHVMQSTDGECTRIFVTTGSADNTGTIYGAQPITTLFANFDKLRDPVAGFSVPVVCSWGGHPSNQDSLVYTNVIASGAGVEFFHSRDVATNMRIAATWDHTFNFFQAFLVGPNTFTGEVWMGPVGAYCPNTATKRGRHGEFYDMWSGPIYPLTSFVLPSAEAPAYVKVGCLYLPWDGVSPTVFI
jgi:hypothetical protein